MTSDDDGWGKAINLSSTEDKATVSGSTRVVMHWGGGGHLNPNIYVAEKP